MYRIGVGILAVSLIVGLAVVIVAAIVNAGWWFAIAVPMWIGLVLIWWEELTR